MPRERIHADHAARTRAYRERIAQRKREAGAGWSDEELGRLCRDFHISMTAAAADERDPAHQLARVLVGETPGDTLRRVWAHVLPRKAR